ncbi:MAG: hypothetical protein ACC707_17935 [Thiohalomonadales bacterium]
MNFPNLSTAGLPGVTSGLENMRRDAQEIAATSAKGNEDTAELANSLVDLNSDRNQVEASVKVVQAIDEVMGTLFNDFA